MINQANQSKLVKIYCFICDENEIQYQCQRFTNNNSLDFTDQEIATIYFCVCMLKKEFQSQRCSNLLKIITPTGFLSYLLMSLLISDLIGLLTLLVCS